MDEDRMAAFGFLWGFDRQVLLFGSAFAGWMSACAVDVWGLFHRFTLRTAILSRSYDTGTDRVRAFLACGVRHVDLLFQLTF
jgi:hypothetical protein